MKSKKHSGTIRLSKFLLRKRQRSRLRLRTLRNRRRQQEEEENSPAPFRPVADWFVLTRTASLKEARIRGIMSTKIAVPTRTSIRTPLVRTSRATTESCSSRSIIISGVKKALQIFFALKRNTKYRFRKTWLAEKPIVKFF